MLSEVRYGEYKSNDSLASLHNDKNRLSREIEDLLIPFLKEYRLSPEEVKLELTSSGGIRINITL